MVVNYEKSAGAEGPCGIWSSDVIKLTMLEKKGHRNGIGIGVVVGMGWF